MNRAGLTRAGGGRRAGAARAITIVESVVSIVVVSLMLVAALGTAGAARTSEAKSSDRFRGTLLAQSLMAEIVAKPYSDPQGSLLLGPEAGETPDATRAQFDDVDDYNGWTGTPQSATGTPQDSLHDWRTEVSVQWINPRDLRQVSLVETGAKLITVRVKHRNSVAAVVVAVRTRGT